jgi:hypothetical protein
LRRGGLRFPTNVQSRIAIRVNDYREMMHPEANECETHDHSSVPRTEIPRAVTPAYRCQNPIHSTILYQWRLETFSRRPV